FPSFQRVSHEEATANRHDENRDPEISKRPKDADTLDQMRCHRSSDNPACSESPNGYASHQTSAVRKPLSKNRDRNDVAESQAYSHNYAVAEIQPPQPAIREACEEQACAIERTARHGYNPWTSAAQPQSAEERGEAQ